MTLSATEAPQRIRAGLCVLTANRLVRDVEVQISGGLVVGFQSLKPGELSDAEAACVLMPGWVNAHTHLDLGALRGAVPAANGFLGWVAKLVAAREELGQEQLAEGARASAAACVRSGTTSVLDIDSGGWVRAALSDREGRSGSGGLRFGPRSFLVREVLDGSPAGLTARSSSALELAREALRLGDGLSPHATHTVGDALLAELGALLRSPKGRGLAAGSGSPVVVHWAETPEENDWLMRGTGPFADWLGPSPNCSGTERLERAGLFGGAVLIHGNEPLPGEIERLARHSCTVVHCPGSHLFFDRAPFPAQAYLASGVPLALGTDSWASNDALDMRREMRLARETLRLAPSSVWKMATENGARCLNDPSVTGQIAEGAAADVILMRAPELVRKSRAMNDLSGGAEEILEALIAGEGEVIEVRVSGRLQPSAACGDELAQ